MSKHCLIFLTILLCLLQLSSQQSVFWEIDSCRITTSSTGTFLLCEEVVECAAEVPGSNVNCSVFTYKPIANMT